MTAHAIRVLPPVHDARDALVDLLVDSVEHGASVNFVWPMTRAKAEHWWDGALASHLHGERLVLIAELDGRIEGTVQVIFAPQENQIHRAEISKLLVHSSARGRGLGARLLRAAEDEARKAGRSLLVLDTEKDSAGDRLYAREGWIKFGEVPGYAMTADNSMRATCCFFYKTV
ncbi:GNAT family N-acetyltransferase [Roseiterribacter gracilis]|uniref:N-acetyltransferase n=1 Tax=Roseiterribacter gracilis TaxID=2812848 RepID=A0A8S8XE32_9PROT|nr:N-acetyltransferase [Rhodospirillales bacterium TMPK1]